ncbi:MAG: hypothetical protein AAFP04_07785 [Myxococcota bacterium]
MTENPFSSLGPPPSGNDPQAQMNWLVSALRTLDQSGDSKLRPLKKRMNRTLFAFQRDLQRGVDPSEAMQRRQAEMDELHIATYRALARTLRQLHNAMKVKRAQGVLSADALPFSRFLAELENGAAAFDDMAEATKRRKPEAARKAREKLGSSANGMRAASA